jgi:hypothetical protein
MGQVSPSEDSSHSVVNKFPAFYGTQMACHWSLSRAKYTQLQLSHSISLRSLLVATLYLHLTFLIGIFPGKFPTIDLYIFPPMFIKYTYFRFFAMLEDLPDIRNFELDVTPEDW